MAPMTAFGRHSALAFGALAAARAEPPWIAPRKDVPTLAMDIRRA